MINNKGFTLTEVLTTLVIISVALFVILKQVGSTLSISKNESYKLMKDNIISSARDYINECNNKIIDCNLKWNDNELTFKAATLEINGYFKNLNSPIDNKNLGNCLEIKATKNNGVINVEINDNCY